MRFLAVAAVVPTLVIPTAPRDYNEGRDTRIDGIIGIGLFSTCLVTLDFARGVLRIERGTLPEPDGKEVVPFTVPWRSARHR